MTTTHENKGWSTSDIVLVILKNYNDARNNECKTKRLTYMKSVKFTLRPQQIPQNYSGREPGPPKDGVS